MKKYISIIILLSFFISAIAQDEEKNGFGFSCSIPVLNSYHVLANSGAQTSSGFCGIATELDYGNSKKSFGIQGGYSADYRTPVEPLFNEFERSTITSWYLSVLRKKNSDLLIQLNGTGINVPSTFYYGLNASKYLWIDSDPISNGIVVNNAFGFILGYRSFIGSHIFIGIEYRPTALSNYDRMGYDYNYQHAIELLIGVKI